MRERAMIEHELIFFLASWSELTTSGHDFQLIGRNYSNEMVQQGQRQTPRSSIHHEFNNLRSSMSSSTSSIQNNMVRINAIDQCHAFVISRIV